MRDSRNGDRKITNTDSPPILMTTAVIKALRKMIIARKICNFEIYPYLSKYLVIC